MAPILKMSRHAATQSEKAHTFKQLYPRKFTVNLNKPGTSRHHI